MANITFNIGKGRIVELYRRVKAADPATSALIIVPLTVVPADATSIDQVTLAAVLAGGSTEQATMGRKVLVAADLATFPAADNTNDRFDVSLPTVTWTAATGTAIVKLLVCYRNATADADSAIVPLTCFDFAQTPSGADIVMTTGVFFRAS